MERLSDTSSVAAIVKTLQIEPISNADSSISSLQLSTFTWLVKTVYLPSPGFMPTQIAENPCSLDIGQFFSKVNRKGIICLIRPFKKLSIVLVHKVNAEITGNSEGCSQIKGEFVR